MILVGWEVRIVKNCDLGLQNAAFPSPRSQFFIIRTDPTPVNWLTSHCIGLRAVYKPFAKSLTKGRSEIQQGTGASFKF